MHAIFQRYPLIIIALLIVIGTFPDVLIGKSSLMITDFLPLDGSAAVHGLNSKKQIGPKEYYDAGGAILQSEPQIGYMRHIFKTEESPFWNPYQATGTLGPETLVDVKFSPLTIIAALFGASSFAANLVGLGFLALSMVCLMACCQRLLNLTMVASTAAALVYMFNGFHMSGFLLNYMHSYLLFPIYLYGLCAFLKRRTILSFILAFISAVMMLSITFIPTTVLVVAACNLLALGYAMQLERTGKARVKLFGLLALVNLCALTQLACIYLPLIQALSLSEDFGTYADRVFYPATFNNLLSMVSPKHLWKAYSGTISPINAEPFYPLFNGNVVFHMGVAAGLLFLLSIRSKAKPAILIVAWVGYALLWLRAFGTPSFEYAHIPAHFYTALTRSLVVAGVIIWIALKYSHWRQEKPWVYYGLLLFAGIMLADQGLYDRMIAAIPVIGSFGEQYIWSGVMVFLPIIAAYGMQTLVYQPNDKKFALVYVLVLFGLLGFLLVIYPKADLHWETLNYVPMLLIPMALLILITHGCMPRMRLQYGLFCVLALMVVEYQYYTPDKRPAPLDSWNHPPEFVQFLKKNIGDQRLLNIGFRGLGGEQASAYQLHDISTVNMNSPRDYRQFYQKYLLQKPFVSNDFLSFRSPSDGLKISEPALDLLGVKYVIVPADAKELHQHLEQENLKPAYRSEYLTIFENSKALPRIFIVEKSAESMALWDGKTIPKLEEKSDSTSPNIPIILDETHTKILLKTTLKSAGTLVLMDAWYPFWKAKVNGVEVSVSKVYEAFRGVELPAGDHQVEFYYDNLAVNLGVKTSIIMLVVMVLIISFAAWPYLKSKRS